MRCLSHLFCSRASIGCGLVEGQIIRMFEFNPVTQAVRRLHLWLVQSTHSYMQFDPLYCVKNYRKEAADSKRELASYLRPSPVLLKTMDYLIREVRFFSIAFEITEILTLIINRSWIKRVVSITMQRLYGITSYPTAHARSARYTNQCTLIPMMILSRTCPFNRLLTQTAFLCSRK